MRIMVFDVPAESGGALSVLQDYYKKCQKDIKNEYVFVISTPKLHETSNVSIIQFPWIKKSWFHRLYFDYFIAPKLVKKYKADKIFSLQNVIVPNVKTYQTVYVHNSLPFVEYRFSFRENRLLWFYQNVISKSIFKSIKNADKVIVQTNWMKAECIKKLDIIEESKIQVIPPNIQLDVIEEYSRKIINEPLFFYPASGVVFKNHKIIVDACIKLKEMGIRPYKIFFTLEGNENKNIIKLNSIIKDNDLPIEFIGNLTREEVFEFYKKSVLIFPSYIESSPLPLTEAKLHGTPILASDYSFSHEVLSSYEKVEFFDAFNADYLADLIKKYVM